MPEATSLRELVLRSSAPLALVPSCTPCPVKASVPLGVSDQGTFSCAEAEDKNRRKS